MTRLRAIQVREASHLITQWDWRMCMVKTKRSAVLQDCNSSPHQRSEPYKHSLTEFSLMHLLHKCSLSLLLSSGSPPSLFPAARCLSNWISRLFFTHFSKNPSWEIVSLALNPYRGLWLGVVISRAGGNPGLRVRDGEIGWAVW